MVSSESATRQPSAATMSVQLRSELFGPDVDTSHAGSHAESDCDTLIDETTVSVSSDTLAGEPTQASNAPFRPAGSLLDSDFVC
jgi:hypothetical protein